jgi:endoglucanase
MFALLVLALSDAPAGMTSDSTALSRKMGLGWNLGNALEACASSESASETEWGNPPTTKALIDAVKASGFNTVRIPCAWSGYIIDQTSYQIDPKWLVRVREVVSYVIDNGMYAILNIHWDGGWLELHPFYDDQAAVNKKQKALWTQIAKHFIDFDEHLLFAGTNEVNRGSGDPEAEHLEVHLSYLQTFIDAVRSTGGNNEYRTLIVQTFCTNIQYGLDLFKIPKDPTPNRLMVEVHYYDPWQFCGEGGNVWLWGRAFEGSSHVADWGKEDWVDDRFSKMKAAFVDKGYPVVIGEYSVMYRKSLPDADLKDHIAARNYFLKYVTQTAVDNGIVPCYWDNGELTDQGCGLFDRKTNTPFYTDAIAALISAKPSVASR